MECKDCKTIEHVREEARIEITMLRIEYEKEIERLKKHLELVNKIYKRMQRG